MKRREVWASSSSSTTTPKKPPFSSPGLKGSNHKNRLVKEVDDYGDDRLSWYCSGWWSSQVPTTAIDSYLESLGLYPLSREVANDERFGLIATGDVAFAWPKPSLKSWTYCLHFIIKGSLHHQIRQQRYNQATKEASGGEFQYVPIVWIDVVTYSVVATGHKE